MSYKALLFCPDEKTARVVTQVLNDLEFRVEPCNEPFAAVKKLMAEHFDAIVVDCNNEQNAALLFKSAHNSGSNQASLAVAVVEGQAGVAKAFRIGANLVLTKPINIEQSKGTLRVARGLLRKSEAARPASATPATNASRSAISSPDAARPSSQNGSWPKPASLPAQPPPSSIPAMSASVLEVEEEPAPKPEPTEAALLESMPDPLESKHHATEHASAPAAVKEYPWQPVAKPMAGPMATALRRAAEAAGKSEVQSPAASAISTEPASVSGSVMGRSFSTSTASGHGAAAAPARQPLKVEKPAETPHAEAPVLTSLTVAAAEPRSGGIKKAMLFAAVLLVTAAGYIAWTKTHPAAPAAILRKVAALVSPTRAQTQLPAATGVPQHPAPAPQKNDLSTASQPTSPLPTEQPSEILPSVPTASPVPKKLTSIIASNTVSRNPVNADATENTPAPIVVKNQLSKPAPSSPAPQEPAQPPAPNLLLGDASNSNDDAISGIVSAPAVSLPVPPAHTVKVSQGVSQGLLVKNVPPVYPALARQMRIQGAVELMANIGKDGNINSVKLISGDSVLSRAAIDAVKQWKYKPYYLDGQPVEIQTQVTVKFKLP